MENRSAPFYLRRVKEALVAFPDPETGEVKKLFKKRDVQTAAFDLEDEEFAFYGALTDYVTNQSAKAASEDSPAARALGFTMAMLQRRFASSAYAARRSLERMRERRQRILEDPEKYRKQQIDKALPDDFDELPDEDQQKILSDLENVVVTLDPAQLASEIQDLTGLIDEARAPGAERGRVEDEEAPRGAQGVGHLRRPEDEAPHLHRAQGHARLPRGRREGRPARREVASSGASRSRRSMAG